MTTFVTGPIIQGSPELWANVLGVAREKPVTVITGSQKEAEQVKTRMGNSKIAGNIVVSPWQSVASPQSEAQKKFIEYLELFQEFIDNESKNTILNEYELRLFRANFKDLVSFFVINQWGGTFADLDIILQTPQVSRENNFKECNNVATQSFVPSLFNAPSRTLESVIEKFNRRHTELYDVIPKVFDIADRYNVNRAKAIKEFLFFYIGTLLSEIRVSSGSFNEQSLEKLIQKTYVRGNKLHNLVSQIGFDSKDDTSPYSEIAYNVQAASLPFRISSQASQELLDLVPCNPTTPKSPEEILIECALIVQAVMDHSHNCSSFTPKKGTIVNKNTTHFTKIVNEMLSRFSKHQFVHNLAKIGQTKQHRRCANMIKHFDKV